MLATQEKLQAILQNIQNKVSAASNPHAGKIKRQSRLSGRGSDSLNSTQVHDSDAEEEAADQNNDPSNFHFISKELREQLQRTGTSPNSLL